MRPPLSRCSASCRAITTPSKAYSWRTTRSCGGSWTSRPYPCLPRSRDRCTASSGGTPADYPTADPASPVLSAALLQAVRDRFSGTGHFIPVNVPGLAAGTYTAYVPTTVSDCLDRLNSSAPEATGRIRKAVFHQDRVPLHVPAFRLPENRTHVYWNAWAAHLIESSAAPGSVELRLVWSSDPTATPHRDPMGS